MQAAILKQDTTTEFATPERCHIVEICTAAHDQLSIARARVEPGVTTKWHRVHDTVERYLITAGSGRVEIGDFPPRDVEPGDVVLIPANVRQRITNTAGTDLIFLLHLHPTFPAGCV